MNVAVIPARGGSKRIPRKNIRDFRGKPIIAYSIETAKESGIFDRIIVSTEDHEIAEVACRYGAEIKFRPLELAEAGFPDCGTQEVVRHVLHELEIREDYACCIYPCAPTMLPADLRQGYVKIHKGEFDYVYIEGWYYFGKVQTFLNHPELDNALFVMPSSRWVDINTEADWSKAENIYDSMT